MSVYKGIDVSKWQGTIDWNRVKKAGVQFAMIRAMSSVTKDPQFERNYTAATAAGIPVGVYLYSYAITTAAAKKEAQALIGALKSKRLSFPAYFDIEDQVHQKLSKAACTAIVKAFCDEMEAAGYWAGVYSYDAFFASHLDAGLQQRYAIWCANVGGKPTQCKTYQLHQYSWKGKIDGIQGDVDLNTATVWYPAQIKKDPERYTGAFPVLPGKGYLGRGDTGEQVKRLQSFLNWYGKYNLALDNSFGPATVEAVKKYQQKAGLEVDGFFGKKSLETARRASALTSQKAE